MNAIKATFASLVVPAARFVGVLLPLFWWNLTVVLLGSDLSLSLPNPAVLETSRLVNTSYSFTEY